VLVEALLKRDYGVVADSRNITKANPLGPRAILHWSMETCIRGVTSPNFLKALLSRRDTCIALPQRYIKME